GEMARGDCRGTRRTWHRETGEADSHKGDGGEACGPRDPFAHVGSPYVYRHLERRTQPPRQPTRPTPSRSKHAVSTFPAVRLMRMLCSSRSPRRSPRARQCEAREGCPAETAQGRREHPGWL